MSAVAYVAALLLAATFVWAGVVKLARLQRTTSTMTSLGIVAPAAAAVAVPLVELGLATTLVVRPRVGAMAALIVLAVFTAFLVQRRRQGVTVGCGCFGSATTSVAPTIDVLRNASLALCALAAAGAVRPTAPTLAAVMVVSVVAALAGVVLALADVKVRVGQLVGNRL